MDKDLKDLLLSIIAQQAVIYKKIDIIERKITGKSFLSASEDHYLRELRTTADKLKNLP
jgi:hypothetical protein